MATEGRVVRLNTSSYSTPPFCCSCGAAQQTQLETSRSQKRGNTTTTLRMRFPYCDACAARVKDFQSRRTISVLIALGVALALGLLVFLVTVIPLAVALVLAGVLGVGGSIVVAAARRPEQPPLPATATGEAARILSFQSGGSSMIYLTNPSWADGFAEANGATSQPKRKGDGFLVGPIVMAVIASPLAVLVAWMVGHPTVYVDNAGPESLQVYVDGKKAAVVPANAHVSMDVGHGSRTFGWSKVGEDKPSATADGDVKVSDAHLYNPQKSASCWLVADVYGSASVDGISQGAQPLREFYHFDKVDTWFGDNPQSIEVSSGSSGGTRVALQRSKSCMQFVEHGCSAESRGALVDCQRASKSNADFDQCFDRAMVSCGKGTAPAVTRPAGGAPAAAPKAPLPAKAPAAPTKKK